MTHSNPVDQILAALAAFGRPARFTELRDLICCDAHAREGLDTAKKYHRITSRGRGSGTEYTPRRKTDVD